ncbi:hypothetical protein ONS95_000098 [Cadophora gregata]|uniref:uncharacterized protein n=1 Tax=Cadophora gregata TaxID=51156 RepID=UPI0026DC9A23|nr:uncharacterized protein ONS95_000098 [Cadophora gregata]KAK0115632.1 hypothetical protein ONS96_014078 [Cadophora gregata f. sp. sojae]KAK0128114.1 hypothetical protein ONS95_000098 [Cadophora gregata]
MESNFNFQGYFQGDDQGDLQVGFQGDFQGLEQDIWGGTAASMQPMVPDDNIDWSQWMDMDAMDAGEGMGIMNDWAGERNSEGDTGFNSEDTIQCHVLITANASDLSLPLSSQVGQHTINHSVSSLERLNQLSALEQVEPESMSNVWTREFTGSQPLAPSAVTSSANIVPSPLKARVRCSRPECKRTFRRKYELQRHEKSVHNRSAAFSCHVYGCNRIAKPLPRKDHFQLHMRKHHNANLFVCIFDTCRFGPLTQQELLDHLNTEHSQNGCCTAAEEASLAHFQWRQTPLSDGLHHFESSSNCLLAFLGCEHSVVEREFGFCQNGFLCYEDLRHMKSHEFIDRSKGYEAIEKFLDVRTWFYGLATCPICQLQFHNSHFDPAFFPHLRQHSKEERISKATDLAEIFRPCLSKKAEWNDCASDEFGAMITADLEEAGMISSAED